MRRLASASFQPFAGEDIRSLIEMQARLRADHPFLVWRPVDGPRAVWTYREFAQRVARIAAGLHARGVVAGDRVLIHLDNCPEAIFSWFGCTWLGAVAVTTNARSSVDELAYYADDAAVVAGITQPRLAAIVAAACPRLRWLAVTTTDNGASPATGAPAASEAFDAIDADPDRLPARAHDPMAPFSVQYTSGTTSRPKGVLWTHANALWGARINATHQSLRADDIHMVTLPLFHTNAQAYSMLATLWAGATAVVSPRFSASRFWPVSVEERCTWASIVPFAARALDAHEVPPSHHYRLWGSGVSEPPTDARFRVKTIGWWGMTETITHGSIGLPHLPNPSLSMGRAAPEYEVRIVVDGRDAEPGETGDFLVRGVRGLSLFAEYLNRPDATAESFDDEGWFITGDRVRLGENGWLYFADRAKDMLKVGGENVAASEIERVIALVPGVLETAVVARRDRMLDEVPVAFVRVEPTGEQARAALVEAVRGACEAALADFKRPREILIVDDFPRATLEKIAKAELRRRLEARSG
ncbi:MAG: AMP-binding protein [Burkholderiaceae bacterium]|nr:AMP-binding protein [Burkholderiaceae bacterium]MEB2319082.1 AMP-binding protein [Pseudomonadota bacterium]